MKTFIFRCPATGYNVQGWHALPLPSSPMYVSQDCPACQGVHIVNPETGKLMSEEVARPIVEDS